MEQNSQSQLKLLVTRGKEQGYLTYAEVNDHLPEEIIDSEQIEDIIQMINDMGIQVVEEVPDVDDLLLAEDVADEDIAEAAAQVLSSVESELGRTTDPVRMYMREMAPLNCSLVKMRSTLPSVLRRGLPKYNPPLRNVRKLLPIF